MLRTLFSFLISAFMLMLISGCARDVVDAPSKSNEQPAVTAPVQQSKNNISEDGTKTPDVSDSKGRRSEIDTSDWKTYRNEEYGFEVRHPGSWKVLESSHVPEKSWIFEKNRAMDVSTSFESENEVLYFLVRYTDYYDITKEYIGHAEGKFEQLAAYEMMIGNKLAIVDEKSWETIKALRSGTGGCGSFTLTVKNPPKNWGTYNVLKFRGWCGEYKKLFDAFIETMVFY